MLVSISIVGIVTALALPSINHVILRHRVKDAAREIASSLHLLRLRAISTNIPTYLDFSVGQGFYTAFVDENDDPNMNPPAETEATQLRFRDALGGIKGRKLPEGVRFGSVTFPENPAGTVNRAGFNPDGMPSSAGAVTLENTLSDSYRVSVVPVTGRVKIWKWDGNTWK